ncbi:MAG: tagatose-6-phosphate ketose isomerase, partial [Glaciimonas sp.]|nr:tagatose-6-phosphate ketose isomerase [Glaciimonas sp.]
MKYLNYDHAWLTKHGAIHTAREISQQPRLWRELLISLEQSQPLWKNWLSDLLATPDLRIILTGAGSSAFAGRALMPWLRETTGLQIDAISTTDIVAHPNAYFSTNSSTKNSSNNPTLLVSFARSGNSPESVAAVALADQLIPNCHHLVLT